MTDFSYIQTVKNNLFVPETSVLCGNHIKFLISTFGTFQCHYSVVKQIKHDKWIDIQTDIHGFMYFRYKNRLMQCSKMKLHMKGSEKLALAYNFN